MPLYRIIRVYETKEATMNDHPLEAVLSLYVDEIDVKESTKRSYEKLLYRYILYLKRRKIRYATKKDIIRYREYMIEEGLSAQSIQKALGSIKAFYRWLSLEARFHGLDEVYRYDVAQDVKNVTIRKNYKREPLSNEEAERLLRLAHERSNTTVGARNYAIIALMITTGVRNIEVLRAKKADLSRLEGQEILYVHGKMRDDTDAFVKLTLPVVDAINNYLSFRSDRNRHLFVRHDRDGNARPLKANGMRKEIMRLFKHAGIDSPRKNVYSLRHTAAYLNLKHGGTLESTQQLLRHVKIETTMIYAHNIRRLEDYSERRIAGVLFDKEALDE